MRDLLKVTGASVIPLAKPRSRAGYEQGGIIATGGGTTGTGAEAKTPMLSWYSSSATIPTNVFPSSVSAKEGTLDGPNDGQAEDPEDEGLETAEAAALRRGKSDAGTSPTTEIRTNGNGGRSSNNDGGDVDGKETAEGASAVGSEAEAKLRVISAAMHAVSVALSALSTLQGGHGDGSGDVESAIDDESDNAGGRSITSPILSSKPSSSGNGGPAGAGDGDGDRSDLRGTLKNGAGADSTTPTTSHPPATDQDAVPAAATTIGNDWREEAAVDGPSPIDGDDPSAAGGRGSVRGDEAAAAAAAVAMAPTSADVGGAVAATDVIERKGATGVKGYGRELARAAGTPTVDAIGGDVHLVAIVAGKRSLTRLLHFVDLVRGSEG